MIIGKQHSQLLIIGAGGHGRVIAEFVRREQIYENMSFLDDDVSLLETGIVVGGSAYATAHKEEYDVIIAIGNNGIRKKIYRDLLDNNVNIVSAIHPTAYIGDDVAIGMGTVIMAKAVVQVGTRIGEGAIVNTSASVDHDNIIGDFVHIAVGAHVAGTVCIGEETFLGAGGVVINNIVVSERCMIGAGAVVIGDIPANCTVVGNPAKIIRQRNS